MITGTLKNQIDKIWDDLASYGVSDPIVAIEQMTYLFFIKSLDDLETSNEKKDEMLQITSKRIFPQTEEGQAMRWSKFCNLKAEEIFEIIGQKVFPFIQKLKTDEKSAYARYMRDAKFALPNALITEKVVTAINNLPLNDRDLKGDVYEYMISKLQTSGRNGQFRTPRHIISMMVELMEPQITDVIADPACGTGGFLVGAGTYVREHNKEKLRLDKKAREHYQNAMFTGYDTNQTMLRISAMNTILHEMDNADIRFMDSLSKDNPDTEKYSLILANPPFTGSLDYDAVAPTLLSTTKTKKTELLFVALFLRMLDAGGRCACIVPDGVLFGSSNAHKSLRKEIVDKNMLQAVISMPGGVFKPYAGVSTGVLIFTKTGTGGTNKVWFYDMQADGYTLDDKRAEDEKHNDIPDIIARFRNLEGELNRKRTDKSFFVSVQEIRDNGYDLSINKYKEVEYIPIEYPASDALISDAKALGRDLLIKLDEIEKLLSE
ncbi:MAG: SAM-dependent DNA methyltransferase [Eubacterium sp.]|nr:SAM-dependent DNA methyltransferase [Eubacterium sp.]